MNFRSFNFVVGNFFLWKKWFYDEIVLPQFFVCEVVNFIAQNCRFSIFQNIEWKMDLNSNIVQNMVRFFNFLKWKIWSYQLFFIQKKFKTINCLVTIFLRWSWQLQWSKFEMIHFSKYKKNWTHHANLRHNMVMFLNFRSDKFEVSNFFQWKKRFYS